MDKAGDYIRFDWAMKHMLRDKSNFGILEGLISVLLNENVTIEEILESESNQLEPSDKFNRVDIKAKNSKGHLILIEVQLTRQLYYLQRILYGACKAITEHISIGNKYDQVKKVYSISILYCDYGQGEDYVYHGETRFLGINTGDELKVTTRENGVITTHFPKEVFPEYFLLRVNQFSGIPTNHLEEWMEYLKHGSIKDDTMAPGLQQVKEKLRVLSMTKEEKRQYEELMDSIMVQNDVLDTARAEGLAEGHAEGLAKGLKEGLKEGKAEGLKEGRAEGKAEGLKEGRTKEKSEIAKKMLSLGLASETVAEATGLTMQQIDELKSNC